jgi:hypothetical protein
VAELNNLQAKQTTGTEDEKPIEPAWEQQLRELTRLSNEVLENGEEMLAKHPLATGAGALALGIVIGRLLK